MNAWTTQTQLTLAPGGRHSFDEMPLPDEENDDHGNRGDHGGGYDDFPVPLAPEPELVKQCFQAARDREGRRVAEVNQGAHEVSPCGLDRKSTRLNSSHVAISY